MKSKSMTRDKLLRFISIILLAADISGAKSATNYKVHFLPIGFSMACGSETPKILQKSIARARTAMPGINERECVDSGKSIDGLKPVSIGVKYDEPFDKWEVIIQLNERDAKDLKSITKNVTDKGASRRLFIEVNGLIVSSGYLIEPMTGKDFNISAESHDEAHKLSRVFVDKVIKGN